jgi:isoamylase
VWWFRVDGRRMTRRDWEHGEAVLGMFLNGQAIASPGPHGEEVEDDSFVLLFNAHAEDREFKLPRRRMGARWALELCTADPTAAPGSASWSAAQMINVAAHSITILRRMA